MGSFEADSISGYWYLAVFPFLERPFFLPRRGADARTSFILARSGRASTTDSPSVVILFLPPPARLKNLLCVTAFIAVAAAVKNPWRVRRH